ncbi:MAG: hypothetical protein ACT4PU_12265 [Planctomycetota bacterium]
MADTVAQLWFWRAKPLLIPLLLGLLLIALLVVAHRRLQRAPRFLVNPAVWQVMEAPDWLAHEQAGRVGQELSAALTGQASLLSGSDLQLWADALSGASPWVESVEALDPRFPGQLDVRLRLRVPVLEVPGGWLLAADGRVLGPGPTDYQPAPLAFDGRHAEEDYLECAAAAAELLPYRDVIERAGVRVLSVGPGPDGTVQFQSEGGAVLNWGRSARKAGFTHLDLSVQARIDNLLQVTADHPGLEGVLRVQLWTDRPVVTR